MNSFQILKQEIIECRIRAKSDETFRVLNYLQEFAENNLNNGWISVDDKDNPPPPNQEVWVWLISELQNRGDSVYGVATDKYIVDKDYKGFGFEYHNNGIHKNNKTFVTHWQPMPQPPKE